MKARTASRPWTCWAARCSWKAARARSCWPRASTTPSSAPWPGPSWPATPTNWPRPCRKSAPPPRPHGPPTTRNRPCRKSAPPPGPVAGRRWPMRPWWWPELAGHANELAKALQEVGATTKAAWATDDPQQALANAVPYMQAFGHTVLAWTWLDVSLAVLAKDAALAEPANAGRMAAMRYFFGYELPKIGAWLKVVRERDMTCAQMSEEAF